MQPFNAADLQNQVRDVNTAQVLLMVFVINISRIRRRAEGFTLLEKVYKI